MLPPHVPTAFCCSLEASAFLSGSFPPPLECPIAFPTFVPPPYIPSQLHPGLSLRPSRLPTILRAVDEGCEAASSSLQECLPWSSRSGCPLAADPPGLSCGGILCVLVPIFTVDISVLVLPGAWLDTEKAILTPPLMFHDYSFPFAMFNGIFSSVSEEA